MTDPLAEKIGINVQGGTVNVQNLNIGIAERLAQSGDRVRILVVAANPLGSSPLKLDHEVKIIQEALRRSRKRDNFLVEYQLAATPSELRRALLDVEPHVLHFSGHGAGDRGLLFVSDESSGAIYRSDSGEVRSRATNSNEIKFVPAKPLASLLQLCAEHLECVVLNACYSDVQGDAISANIPFTIGMRDAVADNVAIKFSQGFYDAIGAGKGYGSAFEWGKVAIEFDLANDQASQVLVLRKKGDSFSQSSPVPTKPSSHPPMPQRSLSASEYFDRAYEKAEKGDKQGAIADYNEAIRLKPDYSDAYFSRGNVKSDLGEQRDAISDYSEAIRLEPNHARGYLYRAEARFDLEDYQGAIYDYSEAIRLNPNDTDAYVMSGHAKNNAGNYRGAVSDYSEAIRLNPNSSEVYLFRGDANFNLEKYRKAIADYNESIRLNPNKHEAYYNLGEAKTIIKDYQGAINDYTRAIRLNKKYAEAYESRGNIKHFYLDESDYEGALLDYTKAAKYYNQSGDEDRYELMCHNIEDIEKSIQMNRQMEQSNRELQEKLENFQQNTKNFSQPNDEIHEINSKDISDMFEWFRKILSDDTESNS